MTVSPAEIEGQNGVGCGHNPEFRCGCVGTTEPGGSQERSLPTLSAQNAAKARGGGRVVHLRSPLQPTRLTIRAAGAENGEGHCASSRSYRRESYVLLPSLQQAGHVPLTFKHPERKARIEGVILNASTSTPKHYPISVLPGKFTRLLLVPFYCHCHNRAWHVV